MKKHSVLEGHMKLKLRLSTGKITDIAEKLDVCNMCLHRLDFGNNYAGSCSLIG